MYQQFLFIGNRELGFEKDHILTMEIRDYQVIKNFEVIKNEWLKNPGIIAVGTSQSLPHNVKSATIVNDDVGGDPDDDLAIYRLRINHEFLEVYGLELIAGRPLPVQIKQGAKKVCLINESAAKAIGFSPLQALGQTFSDDSPWNERTIIGVVKDFHLHPMHLKISPVLIEPREYFQFLSVKVHPENVSELIGFMERTLKLHSNYPFEFQFMDDRVDQLYKSDRNRTEMFSLFSVLAIIIASLGLFGLAALSAHKRVKEIGIRKILGASVQNVLILVNGSFLKMVLAGFLLAIPVAWFLMYHWLQNYAYRVKVQWWMFAFAGLAAMVIAILTISSQSIKAALINPVNCLRNE